MRYIILRNLVDSIACDHIREEFYNNLNEAKPLGLADGDDYSNTICHSTRSKNLSYNYITGYDDSHYKELLQSITDLDFSKGINSKCLPIFCYGEGGEIKAHRGVQKDVDTSKYQEYVAVLQLTQRGEDFNDGRFYLNDKAEASADGKTVTNDLPEDRYYPMLDKGDIIIFHNPSLVHGVETVTGKDAVRMTCSWRTNEKQFNN